MLTCDQVQADDEEGVAVLLELSVCLLSDVFHEVDALFHCIVFLHRAILV